MLKASIPFVDLRGKSQIDLLRNYPDKAHELIKGCKNALGFKSKAAAFLGLPFTDNRSHEWLKRTQNPYLYEIESFAELLRTRGVYSLNLCYEWACTSGVFRTKESVSILRVLDWPVPHMGRHMIVALQSGKAGDFFNITWPGTSGVFNALAPQRFCASINLAPMRKHNRGLIGDWLTNRRIFDKQNALPPPHLLRHVFETAKTYDEAKQMLTHTRIAVPAIFVLAGTHAGEGCVIERLENTAEVLELSASQQLTTANHFNSSLDRVGNGWRPREPDSAGRHKQACGIHGHDLSQNFDWLRSPIINHNTRLALVMDASTRRLSAQGFEGMLQVTDVFNLPPESYEQLEAV